MSGKILNVKQQADSFDSLRQLLELAKNPQSIIDAHELARKQTALTEVEEKKAIEARAVIAKGESLNADLKKKQDDLDSAKTLHDKNVSEFNNSKAAIEQSFVDREQKIALFEKDLNDKQKQFDIDKKAFEASQKDTLDNHAKLTKDLQKQIDFNKEYKTVLDNKAEELVAFETKLKSKAQALKATALEI